MAHGVFDIYTNPSLFLHVIVSKVWRADKAAGRGSVSVHCCSYQELLCNK